MGGMVWGLDDDRWLMVSPSFIVVLQIKLRTSSFPVIHCRPSNKIKGIYSIYPPYQFKLHLSSLCCVIVPLNSLHHANSFSLAHEGSRWQRYGNTSFVPSLSFCVSSCLPSVVSLQLLHYSFNVSPSRLLLHHLPSFARVLLFSFCKPGPLFLYSPSLTL